MKHHPLTGAVKALAFGTVLTGSWALTPAAHCEDSLLSAPPPPARVSLDDPNPHPLTVTQYSAEPERGWSPDKNYAAPPIGIEPEYLFNRGELFLDVFGAFANADTFEIGDVAGGGLGLGYYFTRYLAVYAEAYILDAADQDVAALGGLMVRLPLDDFATAFYAFAEYGGTFGDQNEPSFQFGAGIDLRLTYGVSFFADARGIQNRHTSLDNGELFRIGLRFIF